LTTFAGPEAQVAAISDDIAYNNHDIDDGLRAGLFTVDEISDQVPIVKDAFDDARRRFPDTSENRIIHEVIRDLIGYMIKDVLDESAKRLEMARPESADDVRALDHPVVTFSEAFREKEKPMRRFLFNDMYQHYKVNRMMGQASRVVKELFVLFIDDPNILPTDIRKHCEGARNAKTARIVCDYIAGMTDSYAIAEHRKLFSVKGYLQS